jgi:DNA-directed RNA polymerase specialized sigma24 family protein
MDAHETNAMPVSRLDDAMALLDPQSRRVMELWLDGASPEEISHTLGLSERAVMVIRGSSLWKMRNVIAQRPTPEDTDVTIKTTT